MAHKSEIYINRDLYSPILPEESHAHSQRGYHTITLVKNIEYLKNNNIEHLVFSEDELPYLMFPPQEQIIIDIEKKLYLDFSIIGQNSDIICNTNCDYSKKNIYAMFRITNIKQNKKPLCRNISTLKEKQNEITRETM